MKYIDMENWPRKNHFHLFNRMDYPHFSLCANMDITTLYSYVKQKGHPIFLTLLYMSMKCANSIPEFRYRIRNHQVIEHDRVHPSFTIMGNQELFSFCTTRYCENIRVFLENAAASIEHVKNNINLEDEPGQDDLIYITSIPWVSFTSIIHPVHMHPADSVPRISWGKFFEEGGKVLLPLSVQAHHALMDGLHAGKYIINFRKWPTILKNGLNKTKFSYVKSRFLNCRSLLFFSFLPLSVFEGFSCSPRSL